VATATTTYQVTFELEEKDAAMLSKTALFMGLSIDNAAKVLTKHGMRDPEEFRTDAVRNIIKTL